MKKLSLGLLVAVSLGLAAPAAAQPDLDGLTSRCCGANCCNIDGIRRDQGDVNPDNACEVCNQANACSSWTNICDAGAAEDAGPIAETDAGPVVTVDAGGEAPDAGPPGTDAGTTGGIDAGPEASSGGCAVAHGDPQAFGALLALAALGLLYRRRES